MTPPAAQNRPLAGIVLIMVAMVAISANDFLIKLLSGGYPLHQMVFIRSAIGIAFTLMIVQMEGGWRILKTDQPWAHAARGLVIVLSNMTYFAALAVLPLGEATALFFAAPLFITLLSIPFLGERVGVFRMSAVIVGFLGVLIMQRPWAGADTMHASRIVLLLPVLAAFAYAVNQVMTRRLGVRAKASALALYTQAMFIVVSIGFYVVAGDGHLAEGSTNESVIFLLRAWVMPEGTDRWLFVALGLNSAVVGYCLSQAYRLSAAATLAPFEYVGLPLAILWGWVFWAEIPAVEVWIGVALIVASGLFVFFRERVRERPMINPRPIRRRY